MKYKFRLELYEFNNPDGVDMRLWNSSIDDNSPVSVANGTADSEDIKVVLDYLLKLKEKRYTNETS